MAKETKLHRRGKTGVPSHSPPARSRATEARRSAVLLGALAAVGEGVSVFDADLILVAANERFAELLSLPPEFAEPGTKLRDILRFQADRGDFGTGPDAEVEHRLRNYWQSSELESERTIQLDRVLRVRRRRLADGSFVSIYADVTDTKRAEAALRQSEQRFKDFAEAGSDWFWEWDAERRYTWLSPRIQQVTGRAEGFFIGKRREDAGQIDADDPGYRRHLEDVAARRPFRDFRFRSVYPDGPRWFQQSGKPIFDADGTFVGYRGTGREITALVAAEEQSRLAQDWLASGIGALPHAVCVFDRDGRMVAWNDAYKLMHPGIEHLFTHGTPFETLLRAALSIHVPAIAPDEVEAYVARRMAFHRNPQGSFERQLADGRWQEILESTLPDGGWLVIIHDITERKRAEAGLRASEQRFRDFAEAASDWLWEWDTEQRLTYLSDRVTQVFGLPVESLLGRRRGEVGTVDADPAQSRAYADAIAERLPFRDLRYRLTLPNGRQVLISSSGKPRFDTDGTFLGYLGTGRDITATAAMEQAAKLAQDRLAAAIDGVPVAIGLFDAEDRLVTWNRAYQELHDRVDQKIHVGIAFRRLIEDGTTSGLLDAVGADRDAYLERRIAFHANPVGSFERRLFDGTWQELREFRLPDGGVMTAQTDVTERKQAEEALRRSEQRLALHLDQTPIGAVEWDTQGRVVVWNRAAERIFGYSREEMVDRHSMKLIVPERVSAHVGGVLRDLQSGAGGRRSTNENITKDGRIITCDWYNTSLIGPDGKVVGIAALVQDITERIRTESELRVAKEAAEASDRAKSELLANISHELRTPLNAIIGFSEVIAEAMLGPVGTPRYVEYARDIRFSGVHLLSIINDLLDISKIEAGRFELHEEVVDPSELAEASLRLVRERAVKGGVHCQMAVAPQLPRLQADPRAMKQILLNLLSNAVKFTEPGGDVRLGVHVDTTGGLVFAVSDTGIGIRPEDIPRALAPFTQIDSQFNRRHEGTSLGLPLARKLVELHGGSLDLASTPGQGTTVTVRLPAERMMVPLKVANKQ